MSAGGRIDLIGDREVKAALKHIARELPAKIRRITFDAATEVKKEARANLQNRVLHKRGGTLHNSVAVVQTKPDEALVGTRLVYGPVHEFGAVIKPKRSRFLWWVATGRRPRSKQGWQAARRAGRARWAKQVTIPARPWLGPAFDASIPAIRSSVAGNINKILGGRR